jgi:phage terminase large subunit GpA-like protein
MGRSASHPESGVGGRAGPVAEQPNALPAGNHGRLQPVVAVRARGAHERRAARRHGDAAEFLGFIIHRAPGPAMLVQPTVELGKRFSKQRLASLIENTPELRALVSESKERDTGNTILSKDFPGGTLVVTGANSAVGLRSMPARYLLMDECDAYPATAAGAAGVSGLIAEGSPVDLAIARTANFANRKIIFVSTPTVSDVSLIEQVYADSDQRKYHVPCPHCGMFQVFCWAQVKWPEGKPASAYYECARCNGVIGDHHKLAMLEAGEWRAEGVSEDTAGFWLSGLYSPWATWAGLARDFLRARKSPEKLQAFTNCALAETFQQSGAVRTAAHELLARREAYDSEEALPAGVVLLTAGIDVQADRLEMELVGWGRDETSWSIAYLVLPGDTSQPEVWQGLDQVLAASLPHPCGREATIAVTCIDAGFRQPIVQSFCADHARQRVLAIKGVAGQRPIWSRAVSHSKDRQLIHLVGVDACKEALYARLKITDPDAGGYCHFPVADQYDLGYFSQLTSEVCKIRYSRGHPFREWYKPPGARNEALDCRNYAYAALQAAVVSGFKLNRQADEMAAEMGLAPGKKGLEEDDDD